jgi:hypothetical protein
MLVNKSSFGGVYKAECYGEDGRLKWSEEFPNLVVNQGLAFINTQVFQGANYSATWYMGIIDGGATYSALDTMSSHAGWTENVDYLQAARPTMVFNSTTTANPAVIASIAVSYTMSATATVGGAFLTTDNTKGGTNGTLLSAGNFTVGNRGLVSGDTLNVTYTFSATAA